MSNIADLVLADLDHEFSNTRRMLERVPSDKLDYTPHEKSFSLGRLANHITDMPALGLSVVTRPGFAFDAPRPAVTPATTPEQFVARWDERVAALKEALGKASDEDLKAVWKATAGPRTVVEAPRIAVLRGMVLSHMIHHRAQLTVYYRINDVPLPGLYGPSADEA